VTRKERLKRRKRLQRIALFCIEHAEDISYVQERPMREMLHCPPRINSPMDCSEYHTFLHCCAGFPDPNGTNYDGTGFTGTIFSHGKARKGRPRIGDAVLFHNPEHVATVYKTWPIVRLTSHGSEGGPYRDLRLDYRTGRYAVVSVID